MIISIIGQKKQPAEQVCGLGIKERNFYEKNKRNDMVDKNKEAIKILEENKLTNIHSPEDKIKMEIDRTRKVYGLRFIIH